jgi:hypothetical protein
MRRYFLNWTSGGRSRIPARRYIPADRVGRHSRTSSDRITRRRLVGRMPTYSPARLEVVDPVPLSIDATLPSVEIW